MMWRLLCLFFATLCSLEPALGLTSKMVPINTQCACPGDIFTYTCIAVGGGTTLWRGTAFKCGRSNEIALRHSRFASGGINGTCNNGAIVGQSIGVQDNCYISQLDITVGAEFNNKTINCVHDSIYSNSTLTIGKALLRVISAANSYPQPSNISLNLDKIHLGELIFNWTAAKFLCSSKHVEYIITSDCGICPNFTYISAVTCAGVQVSTEPVMCSFRVNSIVCNTHEDVSSPISVTLKVPDAPNVTITPIYSQDNQTLVELFLKFTLNKAATFFPIYDNISGHITYYKISYQSKVVLVKLSSLCEESDTVCNIEYNVNVPSCPVSTNIGVSVIAANKLGEGPPSNAVTLGCINEFVRVNFDFTTSTFSCAFLNVLDDSEKSCDVIYRQCHQQLTQAAQGCSSDDNPRVVSLMLQDLSDSIYCYTVTASSNISTVMVEGVYDGRRNDGLVIIVIPPSLLILSIIIIIIILLLIIYCKSVRRKKSKEYNRSPRIQDLYFEGPPDEHKELAIGLYKARMHNEVTYFTLQHQI